MTAITDKKILLGTRKGLIVFKESNGSFVFDSTHHQGIPIAYAMRDANNQTLWTCHDHGHWGQKMMRSKDDGKTWEKIDEPKYPEDALIYSSEATWENVSESNEKKAVRQTKQATLRLLWVLANGGSDQDGTLYAGTEPGGLFVSHDNGDHWELVRGLWDHPSRLEKWTGGGRDMAGIHSILIDPRDSNHIYIGVSVAGVFETTDGGKSWVPRNKGLKADFLPDPDTEIGHDPHQLNWSCKHPETLWQQNHCGIFVSQDAGLNWTNVSEAKGPANFGFPISVCDNDPATAWVVPANGDGDRSAYGNNLTVCRTENYGESWTPLTKGLPQDSWDLVYRHALDISGDTLVFGSTTGNAYISYDRGDSWQCLGNNFPPIYSVRFA